MEAQRTFINQAASTKHSPMISPSIDWNPGESPSIISNREHDGKQNKSDTNTNIKKICVAIIILSLILFATIDSRTNKHVQTAFQSFLTWISTHIISGILAFIILYATATVSFLPGSILTLGSGFVYGKVFGLGYGVAIASGVVFVGACCGAVMSFLLGRYLSREWVGERLVERYPMVKALDEAFRQNGLQIFLLLRLSPIIPFNAINYIGGVTAISLRNYTLALIGIVPGTILYCFIGASAGSLSESQDGMNNTVTTVVIVVGIILGLLAVSLISMLAKKEFDKIVSEQEQQVKENEGFDLDPIRRSSDIV